MYRRSYLPCSPVNSTIKNSTAVSLPSLRILHTAAVYPYQFQPFLSTAVPFWGQTTRDFEQFLPKRDSTVVLNKRSTLSEPQSRLRGQTSQIPSALSPKRDCGPERAIRQLRDKSPKAQSLFLGWPFISHYFQVSY